MRTCSECIGVVQLASDWGVNVSANIFVDSSAALGVGHRRGNGKLRHVRVGSLWIQEMVEDGEVSVKKVHGFDNMSDVLTKNVPGHLLDKHTAAMGLSCSQGRAESGLAL